MNDNRPPDGAIAMLIAALRARGLDRVAVAYAVAGWIVVQAASILVPSFEAATWVLRAIIIFVLLGFPMALLVAWFAAPFGYDAHAETRPRKGTHAVFAAIVVLVVAVAGDLAYLLSRLPVGHAPRVAAAALSVARNSIAVLPFVNMSGDPGKDYFSDGMSEELLNDLANIPQLVVAARTSSFAFKGRNENIRDIARALSVRSVLEGSVRESGQHLRITVQLIDAADGYHLWSATYDRDLTDVLVVQEEIARAITAALTGKLLPAHQPKPHLAKSIDPEAYRAYLLGKQQMAPRTEAGAKAAQLSFSRTARLAPDFADGFAELARAEINLAENHPERRDLLPAAEHALARALALDPRNVDALGIRLDLSLHRFDWPGAIADATQMRKISPNSARVLHEMFRFYLFTGFPDLALAAARGAAKLDPLSFVDRLNAASLLLHDARYGDAIVAARAALALEKDQPEALTILCSAAAYSGDLKQAHAVEAKFVAAHDSADLPFCRFPIAIAEHRLAAAHAMADALAATYLHGGTSAFEIGEKYAIAGDTAKALDWLKRSVAQNEFFVVLMANEKIVPDAFFRSPGWQSFFAAKPFDDWRKAHDQIAANLAARG